MIRTSQILFWFGLVIAASLALYRTSDRVTALDQQLRTLNASIEKEQQSIHVLRAEWVYLANPARIEAMSHKFLPLRPTSPQQIARLNDIADVLPTREEAMASVAVTGTPIASIETSLQMPAPAPHVAARQPHDRRKPLKLAAADGHHINNRMIIQRTASAQPLPDSIGTLIDQLGTHP